MMDIYEGFGPSDGNLDGGVPTFSTDPHERAQPLVKAASTHVMPAPQ